MIPSVSATKSTKAIFNAYAVSGTSGVAISALSGAIATASGAMTANTLKSFLSVSGTGGQMSHLAIKTNDATARTIRVELIIDGVPYDFTTASIAISGDGVLLAGVGNTTTTIICPPIFWQSTFIINVASSVTETDKLTIYWIYNTEA